MLITTDLWTGLNKIGSPVTPEPLGMIEVNPTSSFPFGILPQPIRANNISVVLNVGSIVSPTPTIPQNLFNTFGSGTQSVDSGIVANKSAWFNALIRGYWRLDYTMMFFATNTPTAGSYTIRLMRETGESFNLDSTPPAALSAGVPLAWSRSLIVALDQDDWHPYWLFSGNTAAGDNTAFRWNFTFSKLN